jgi:hypothetical protein
VRGTRGNTLNASSPSNPEAGPQNFGDSLQHQREKGNIVNKPYTYPPKQLFTAFGPRKAMIEDDKGKVTGFENIPERIRFETVLEEHAVAFAQDVYRRENIILDITSQNL